ncbi:TonB-dependent siderophore receptor [Caenispirillum bisanense]
MVAKKGTGRAGAAGMAAAAVLAPVAVLAQDAGSGAGSGRIELAPVMIEAATRVETPVDEVSRSVTVVTREEIEKHKQIDRSLGDILSKTVPGFSQSTEANTDYGQTLRGRTFLTMIDGVPQSTPLRDGRRSLNSIDADAIERIEVVRGGTALYGFGATGGLVNIVTRRPAEGALTWDVSQGASFSATHPADSLGTQTNIQASGRSGQVDYLANGSYVRRGGSFDADGDRIAADPVGAQGGISDSDTVNFLGKLGYEFDDNRQRVQLSGNYYDMKQDSDWAGLSMDGDPARGIKTPAVRGNYNPVDPGTKTRNLSLDYEHREVLGSSVKAQAYYADQNIVYSKFPGYSQTRIESEKLGSRLTVNTPVEAGPLPFTVTWGVDYLRDDTVQTATDGPDNSPAMLQNAVAGFAQVEVPVLDYGTITGGMRYEHISLDISDFTNRNGDFVQGGSLTYGEPLFNLTGTVFLTDHLDLYGGFSQGFTVAEIGRSLSDGAFRRAEDAEAEVQKTNNYELGLRATYDRWTGSVVGFVSTSDNGVSFDRDLRIIKQPERIYGVEVAATVAATDALRLGGSLTWMEGRVDLDDDGDYDEDMPTTSIPPLKVTAFAEYDLFDWWTARVQGLYSGTRSPNSSQFGGTSDIDDYVLVDLYSAFDVGVGTLTVGIENLLNASYFPVINQAYDAAYAYAKGPGTTVTATYSVQF